MTTTNPPMQDIPKFMDAMKTLVSMTNEVDYDTEGFTFMFCICSNDKKNLNICSCQ